MQRGKERNRKERKQLQRVRKIYRGRERKAKYRKSNRGRKRAGEGKKEVERKMVLPCGSSCCRRGWRQRSLACSP
jgi:hypothetical protein